MSITINGTTGVSGVDGSSTTPAFQGTDIDTGLFYSANTVSVSAGGSKVATINGFGIGLGTGSPSSGIGITFPATQSASSDANTLDDYEEGTWTPNVYAAAGANPTFTSSGRYTKIGRTVIATAIVTFTSTAGSVGIYMDGVPFSAYSASALTGFGSETTTSRTLNVNPGNATTVLITRYDGVFYEASGYNYIITLVYSV